MSCYGCNKKYGLFCKEHGCPSCGYSYCAKCLSRKAAVPRHGGKILNVCLICKDKLSKLEASEKVIDCEALPGTLVTKVGRAGASNKADVDARATTAALLEDDPPTDLAEALMPISAATKLEHSNAENDDIVDNLDDEICKRLKNLKSGDADNTATTDADIRARLSNLSGVPQKDYSKKDLLLSTDQRTDEEKMKDLLEQFMGETQLDQRVEVERMDAISDIERRLRALRDAPVDGSGGGAKASSPDTNTPSDNEQDDETVLKAIMEKYLAEARLPEPPSDLETELISSIPRPPPNTQPGELEELPFCNICNEDGVFRCKGCDGEIFCVQCFREVHDDDEYRAHEKVPYQAPPQFKEDHF